MWGRGLDSSESEYGLESCDVSNEGGGTFFESVYLDFRNMHLIACLSHKISASEMGFCFMKEDGLLLSYN